MPNKVLRSQGFMSVVSSASYAPKFIEDQACSADRDGTVGDVEARKMPLWEQGREKAEVKVEKIHHVPMQQAVDHVAQRAAEDQADSETEQSLLRMAPQHPDDEDRRRDAQPHEE